MVAVHRLNSKNSAGKWEGTMKGKRGLRVALKMLVVCAVGVGALVTTNSIALFVNEEVLGSEEAKPKHAALIAPIRDVAEAMEGEVSLDKESHSLSAQTGITKERVAAWITEQGNAEKDYYLEGLTFEEVNIDEDIEPEVLARIDGGVHLGDFFIFDKQADGSYQLIFEQPWQVESWSMERFRAEGMNPIFNIVTRTGGTGIDVIESHLMYMDDAGVWTEAWKGTLKDRSAFQDKYHLVIGSYQFNDDHGELFYWQTEMDASLEDDQQEEYQQEGDLKTSMTVFTLQQGKFIEKK